ncbi:MAG: hypothetical protein HYY52_02855 [Candidatus Melainabacteria bacterium]|nr:hypothetical protein [Candidatus Melainabacteria bacterium]
MNKNRRIEILFLILIILLFSIPCCRNLFNEFKSAFLHNDKLKPQINNNKSELLFWNFRNSLKSDAEFVGKVSFFEIISIEDKSNKEIVSLGMIGDMPVCGDFSGDGIIDYGIYRYKENGNEWNLINGSTKVSFTNRYGEIGDLPVPGDYDGDGIYDFVVYKPKDAGFYGILSYMNKILQDYVGIRGDIPTPSDYDGDGLIDLSVYRPSSGEWLIKFSKTGLIEQIMLGGKNFLPIPSDYDGDRKADLAVWNFNNNKCKIVFTSKIHSSSNRVESEVYKKLTGKKIFPLLLDIDRDKKYELAFWEDKQKSVHLFKIGKGEINYEEFNVNVSENSEPVNYFLLRKFVAKDGDLKSLANLRSVVNKGMLNVNKGIILCDFDGDFIKEKGMLNLNNMSFSTLLSSTNKSIDLHFNDQGKPVVGDFDGDGKCELGFINPANKAFSYSSSALNKNISFPLNEKVDGIPFVSDIDSDFMADLILYDPVTAVCSLFQSSKNYKYDEVCLE